MGRRYAAILRYLGMDYETWDIADGCHRPPLAGFSHVLIATPTDTHVSQIQQCVGTGVTHVLCEKPLCMDATRVATLRDECQSLRTYIHIVCNWSYVLPWRLTPESVNLTYRNWYTGPHGADWDCCQLHYLQRDRQPAFVEEGPAFMAFVDGYPVSLADIDRSYIAMLRDWYEAPSHLWGLADAVAMERKVEAIIASRKER